MESQGGKIKNKDGGFELVTEDSVTDSVESSCSSSCESPLTCTKSPSAHQLVSPFRKASISSLTSHVNEGKTLQNCHINDSKPKIQVSNSSEMEMVKARFAKLLLGEDMSGSGKGVCPALAISNAITNLSATVFGQLWRLEPLPHEKKAMWQREMEWLLCPSDYIVELTPSWQTLPDGNRLEVMASRPRSDLVVNLPALRKLDNMLLEILDAFTTPEFWYVDQGVITPESDRSGSQWNSANQRHDDKWWLPVPRVLPEGLSEGARKDLSCKRDCANQILKAAISINDISLAEMEVPESYMETLPKTGRACLGDVIYRYITSDHFSAECLLNCLDLSSEHIALDMANRVEAAIHVWRRRKHLKPPPHSNRSSAKPSWRIMADGDKREASLAERADSLLTSLKQRFPGLAQTTLDTSKILCNKDVGKSILESYSRVLECLAFNIVARIEDILYVDDISKRSSNKCTSASQKKVAPFLLPIPSVKVPVSGTPYRSFSGTPTFSPVSLISPAKGDRTPFLMGNNKAPRRGLGVKRALNNYLGGERESKVGCGNILEGLGSISSRIAEGTMSRLSMEGKENFRS